jgi:hypothetical protein
MYPIPKAVPDLLSSTYDIKKPNIRPFIKQEYHLQKYHVVPLKRVDIPKPFSQSHVHLEKEYKPKDFKMEHLDNTFYEKKIAGVPELDKRIKERNNININYYSSNLKGMDTSDFVQKQLQNEAADETINDDFKNAYETFLKTREEKKPAESKEVIPITEDDDNLLKQDVKTLAKSVEKMGKKSKPVIEKAINEDEERLVRALVESSIEESKEEKEEEKSEGKKDDDIKDVRSTFINNSKAEINKLIDDGKLSIPAIVETLLEKLDNTDIYNKINTPYLGKVYEELGGEISDLKRKTKNQIIDMIQDKIKNLKPEELAEPEKGTVEEKAERIEKKIKDKGLKVPKSK